MPSPFPGMDPYLEHHWRDVHLSLITYARNALQRKLPAGLRARGEEQVYVESPMGGERLIAPDIRIITRPARAGRPASRADRPGDAAVAVSEPIVVHVPERTIVERSLQIIDLNADGRIVTTIEILSPSNKLPGKGRERYLRKQNEMVLGGVNLVEIDLIRAGTHVLVVEPEDLPEPARSLYRASVWRAEQPESVEVHPFPLRERLPALPIPLREDDDDVVLALQELIDDAYRDGGYDDDIDYRLDLDPPLDPDDASWAAALLRDRGLR